MTKFLGILVLFICQSVFCQEFYFDTFLEYDVSYKNKNAVDTFMLNSSDADYVFYRYSANGMKGKIYDHKKNMIHYYSLSNNNNSIEFKYLYSERDTKALEDMKKPCYSEIEKYQVTQNKIDSLNQSFEVIEYRNIKKKRIERKVNVAMTKLTDSNNFPSIVYGYFNIYLKCKIVSFPKGYIPVLITKSSSEGEVQIKLKQTEKISTVLSLKPEDIKYRNN